MNPQPIHFWKKYIYMDLQSVHASGRKSIYGPHGPHSPAGNYKYPNPPHGPTGGRAGGRGGRDGRLRTGGRTSGRDGPGGRDGRATSIFPPCVDRLIPGYFPIVQTHAIKWSCEVPQQCAKLTQSEKLVRLAGQAQVVHPPQRSNSVRSQKNNL